MSGDEAPGEAKQKSARPERSVLLTTNKEEVASPVGSQQPKPDHLATKTAANDSKNLDKTWYTVFIMSPNIQDSR